MSDDIPDGLLECYCAGDCTPSERAEIERWLAADPARAEYLALLTAARHEVLASAAPVKRPDVPAAWERVRSRVLETGHPALQVARAAPERALRPSLWRRLAGPAGMGIAAALVLAVGATLLIGRLANRAASVAHAPSASAREIATRRGQRTALDLPDGSRVILGPESRLRIPPAYESDTGPRELFLEGEAYFRVQHDRLRPFLVHAASGVIEDLGTEFVVTAYPETRGVQVVVATGAVALRSARPTGGPSSRLLTLRRGQLGWLDTVGIATITREIDVAPYLAWTDGSLAFDSTPMRDVVPRLARWYDLDIRLADSGLAERRLTTTFRDESAVQVLEALAISLDLRIEKVGRHVVLSRKHPQLQPDDQHSQGIRP